MQPNFKARVLIDEATVIERIRHLGVPTAVPAPCPARAPPPDPSGWDDEAPRFSIPDPEV